MMDRRTFISALAGGWLSAPLGANAQAVAKIDAGDWRAVGEAHSRPALTRPEALARGPRYNAWSAGDPFDRRFQRMAGNGLAKILAGFKSTDRNLYTWIISIGLAVPIVGTRGPSV